MLSEFEEIFFSHGLKWNSHVYNTALQVTILGSSVVRNIAIMRVKVIVKKKKNINIGLSLIYFNILQAGWYHCVGILVFNTYIN